MACPLIGDLNFEREQFVRDKLRGDEIGNGKRDEQEDEKSADRIKNSRLSFGPPDDKA